MSGVLYFQACVNVGSTGNRRIKGDSYIASGKQSSGGGVCSGVCGTGYHGSVRCLDGDGVDCGADNSAGYGVGEMAFADSVGVVSDY